MNNVYPAAAVVSDCSKGLVTRGANSKIGINSRNPAIALKKIAGRMANTDDINPISKAPKGVPVPMKTLRSPIMRPRISCGADSIVIVLCIVLNPDWPMPPIISKTKAGPYHGDHTNNMAMTKTTKDPKKNIRP